MYSDLYKAWKAEKTTEKPQPLQSDFYQRASAYLKGLESDSAAGDARTVQSRLLIKEMEITQRLLEELKQARLHKIINSTRDGTALNANDLTQEEQVLVTQFNQSLSSYNEQGEKKHFDQPPPDLTELSVVRFLNDVPEIVGVDLKMYGPYKKEDVGSLPNQNAQALINQGLAKEIDVRRVSNSPHEK